jgi:hypothetical protein
MSFNDVRHACPHGRVRVLDANIYAHKPPENQNQKMIPI